jgi:transposase
LQRALGAHILQADDTPVTVLDNKAPGGSKRGHLWVYLGDKKWIAFDYTPDWKADRPRELLGKRPKGWTQADGYAGYDAVFNDAKTLQQEVGCWSHGRRRFIEALTNDKRAAEPVRLLKQLFRIEELARAKNMSAAQRLELRKTRSKPIHDKLAACLGQLEKVLAPKDDLADAIQYAKKRWIALSRYLEDGHLEMTNNDAERALRHIAIGRANWQFAGSDVGGQRAAILYTIVATVRAAGQNVRDYRLSVMPRLVEKDYASIDDLLPSHSTHDTAEEPLAQQQAAPF